MFEFYFSFLKKIALCCHFLITFSSKCDLMELELNEFIMPLQQNVRLIEMDSDNFEQLNQITFVLTEQAFNISYLESEKIRSTIISNFIFYNSTQQQWICRLLKYQSYNILCNNDIKLNPTDIDILNMELQFKVDIMTEAQYNCDEFFQWQISNFLLFCSSQNIIKIYSVDISNTTLLITEKEIDQHQFDQCIREYIKQSEEQYFIILYGCFQWAIFEFSGSSLDLLIDQYIMLNKTNQTIPYVQRIQICKYLNKDLSEYYLITNNGYYQFQVNNKNKQLSWVSFEKFQNIQQLVFIKNWCKVNYLIIYQNQTTSIIINILKKELVSINSNVIQVHESSNLIFLLSNKSLDVIMNQQIKQHIQLQANHLFFLDNDKYFYYIDELNSQISFYSYNDLNQFLIPKKTYVFKVLLKDQFEISLLNCYKVNIINNIDKAIVFNDIHLLNSCQEHDSIIFDKQCIELPEQYDFQVQQVSISTILNITDIVEFQNNCDIRFISKDSILIYREDNYAIFKNNHFITIQECINNINYKIPIQTYSVFQYHLFFLIIKKGDKLFKIIQQSINYQISVENEIESFSQFQNHVLIITKMGQNFMIISINNLGQEKLSQNLITKLFQIYSREQPNNHPTFFYQKKQNYQFIEFHSNLLIYDRYNDQIIILPFQNIQIISIKNLINNVYQIIAVHLIDDVIFQYIFTYSQQLILQYNYTIINAKIQRPLKFNIQNHQTQKEEQSLLIILVDKDQEHQIQILRVSHTRPLKLIRIINVSIPEFFIVQTILHYYDQNFEIRAIDIFQFHVKLKNLNPNQRDAFSSNNLTFYIVSKYTTENVIKCIFRLNQYNLCHQIYNIHNQIEIILNNKQKQQIQINDFFVGPINNLYITNNSLVKLNGFYLQHIPILFCSQLNKNNCIITINLSNKLLPDQNKKFIAHILKQQNQNIFLSLIDEQKTSQKGQNILLDIFLINQWQLAILSLIKKQIIIIIQDIDKDTFEVRNEQQFQLQTNFDLHNYKIHFTGSLIQIKQQNLEILFFTKNYYIKYQEIQRYQEGLISVENSNQLYIELQSNNKHLIINILEFDDTKFELIHFVEVNFTIINNLLNNHFNEDFTQFQQFISNHILKSIQKRNQINLIVLQEYQFFSLILNISLQLNDTSFQFEIQQVIRNPKTINNIKQIFYQYNILILTSDREQRYIYDLNQKRQFYDYNYIENSTSKFICSINSTHFIFQNSNQNYSIGQLNYEIELLEGHSNQETCILVAENSLAKTNIKLIIAKQSVGQIWTIVLLTISSFLILLFISISLLIKIKKKRNNVYQTQIELQNSIVSNLNL